MKMYVAYTTVEYEDAFSIIGVFDELRLAVTAVIETFGYEIELDQDPGVACRWRTRSGRDIWIEEFGLNGYVSPCDNY